MQPQNWPKQRPKSIELPTTRPPRSTTRAAPASPSPRPTHRSPTGAVLMRRRTGTGVPRSTPRRTFTQSRRGTRHRGARSTSWRWSTCSRTTVSRSRRPRWPRRSSTAPVWTASALWSRSSMPSASSTSFPRPSSSEGRRRDDDSRVRSSQELHNSRVGWCASPALVTDSLTPKSK